MIALKLLLVPSNYFGAAIVTIALFTLLIPRAHGQAGTEINGTTMGTFYSVTLAKRISPSERNGLQHCARRALARVDKLLSTWRDDSELARINAHGAGHWIPTSDATRFVLEQALAVSRLTAGAFDPTIAPLLTLWGFGPGAQSTGAVPSHEQLERTRRSVGFHLIDVDHRALSIRKARSDVKLDFSGMAKGFAADLLSALVHARGLGAHLINIGGEVRARGDATSSRHWNVGIESPAPHSTGIVQVLRLVNGALATSGTYRRQRQVGEQALADIIDPRTGQPVSHHLSLVSVVAPNAAQADALATGLLVLGPSEGMALAKRHDIATLFVTQTHGIQSVASSPAFVALTREAVDIPAGDASVSTALIGRLGCLDLERIAPLHHRRAHNR